MDNLFPVVVVLNKEVRNIFALSYGRNFYVKYDSIAIAVLPGIAESLAPELDENAFLYLEFITSGFSSSILVGWASPTINCLN
jgi:hypothetical protein